MTWDKALFPNPEKLQNDIASRGRKMVTIVDPHIKRDPAYPIFKNAEEKGYYVKNKDGKDYDGCAVLKAAETTCWRHPAHVASRTSCACHMSCTSRPAVLQDKCCCTAAQCRRCRGWPTEQWMRCKVPRSLSAIGGIEGDHATHAGGAGRARRRTWT